ncbi:MAG TPA: tetratricopeptide repeat protein, partial [Roseiflexaceae bacterium]|nr:tetratricopeptide repeat protein [Roseiflexaceae bacterium]
YETCRRILARDLGVEPEAETTALYERIRHSTSSELRVLSAEIRAQGGETQTSNLKPQNIQNFPAQATPLIGRETELAELGALLENPAHRLITIVGPGGVGKTRLALAAATEETEVFTDGGAFVPLAAIRAAAFVAPAILAALDVPLQGQRDPREQLLDYLREKELLLVLDNFEQLLAPDQSDNDGITELVSEILAHAPDVTLLITWRERLALPGEWLFDLSGLSYPAGDPSDGIEGYSAVELFVQRASQVRRQFALADGEVRAVARICRLIEGLPLAIELAAAALRTHSCAAIADAIETSLSALTSRLRAIPERHRSIWATFEHSWRLLSEEERQVLARLSVFRGGFEEEAAAQVARASPQLLAALVDKSLLRWDGVARYDMHELVRQYAGAKLEQVGKARSIRNHHVAYYLALAETAEPLLSTSDQRVWLDRLEQDHDNLRAALAWAVDHNPDGALRLSGALADFWLLRGHLSQGRQWIERALAGADARARAGADPDHSAGASPHATAARAKALHGAGRIGHVQEDNVRAEELFVESLTLARALGDPRRVALLLNDLGELVLQRGDSVQAMTLYTEGLTLARAADDRIAVAHLLLGLGDVARAQGEVGYAAACYQESLAIGRALDDRRRIAWALHRLGALALEQGAHEREADAFAEGLALARDVGDHENTAWLLYFMGRLLRKQHDLAGAAARFAESAQLLHVLGAGIGVAANLVGLADVKIQYQEPAQAARLLSAAEPQHWPAWAAAERTKYDHSVAAIRAHLDQATFAAAWAAGRAMTLERAIAYALEGSETDAVASIGTTPASH